MLKRVISFILCVVMLVSMFPVQTFAVQDNGDTQALMDSQEVDFEGTNAVGSLLAQAISQEQQSTIVSSEDTPYEDGYSLTDIVIHGNVATVTYDALEEAQLVVALYVEDGLQLLNTAKTMVSPEETTATVTFSGEMPRYFTAAAYLLDVYDYSPLCPAYETPMYTRDMQELLAMTVDDCVEEYGDDRILNLDDSEQTNFAVYAEGTVLLYEEDGVNTVSSVDDTNLVYVFENADERVTSLEENSVVVYEYADGDLLLLKVDSIDVDGSMVTIQGMDMEIAEVFAIMKVEGASDPEDTILDPSELDEGVEYLGQGGPQTYGLRAVEGEGSGRFAHVFHIWDKDGNLGEIEGKFEGTITAEITASVNFFISFKRQFVEFKLTPELSFEITAKASFEKEFHKFAKYKIPICYGVKATCRPTVKLKITGEAHLKVGISLVIGASIENTSDTKVKFQNLSTKPLFDINPDVMEVNPDIVGITPEIKLRAFLGVCFNPSIDLVSEKIATGKLDDEIGLEIDLELLSAILDAPNKHGNQPSHHTCNFCIQGAVNFIANHTVKFEFLKSKKLKFDQKILEIKFHLVDFYWSLDHVDMGIGTCPYVEYRVYVNVKDKNKHDVVGTDVYVIDATADGRTKLGTTNSDGLAVWTTDDGEISSIYLPKGQYIFETLIDGICVRSQKPVVVEDATFTVLVPIADSQKPQDPSKLPMIMPDDTTASSLLDYGDCGDGVKWRLYTNNTLEIYGAGAMNSYGSLHLIPWYQYKDQITSVRVGSPLTSAGDSTISVGDNAFNGCTNLQKVILEDNVTSLGWGSFKDCTGLTEIKLPVDIYDDQSAFANCSNITNIHYTPGRTGNMRRKTSVGSNESSPDYFVNVGSLEYYCKSSLKGAYLDEGVRSVAAAAFKYCEELTSVSLPSTLEVIGNHAFYNCRKLKDIEIPSSVTLIAAVAFHGCTSLPSITIPSGVTRVYQYTFSGCRSMEEVVIPDTVTNLDAMAFSDCRGLTKITMPVDAVYDQSSSLATFTTVWNINTIHYTKGQTGRMSARASGTSLESICKDSLTSVIFDEGIQSIADGTFKNCTALNNVLFKGNAPSIGSGSFSGVTADVLYPYSNETWTAGKLTNYGGNLTWIPYILDENGNICTEFTVDTVDVELVGPNQEETEATEPTETEPVETEPAETEPIETEPVETDPIETEPTVTEPAETESAGTDPAETEPVGTAPLETEPMETIAETICETMPSLASAVPDEEPLDQAKEIIVTAEANDPAAYAVYGGMNEAEFEEEADAIVQNTVFSGLVPGSEYVMFALASLEVEDLLAPSNILYIGQAPAGDNGSLNFRYIQRTPTSEFNVFACGASHRHLKDAIITFPKIEDNGELQIAEPTITYSGKKLVEGVDYVVLDGQGAKDAGDYLCTIRGICNYTGLITCSYRVDTAIEYTYGQNVQIKLIEPWGIRANAKISTSTGVVDYSSLYDYGVYFIRKSALDRAGLTQSTITVADIVNDADAQKQTKADGVTISSGYLSAIYDNDIYTYELDDSVFVMFYFITEEGADPIYVPIRERNLKTLAEQRMNDAVNFPNQLEREVYQKMTKLETDVTDYRSDFANLSAPEKQKAPTLAQYPLGAPAAVNNYSYGQNAQIKLIEPWGLKANVKVSQNGSVINYNAVEEYGIVALADNSKVYEDASEILQNQNAYVFSSKNGDAIISNGYISATYSKDIFTYQLDTDIYVFGYVKDADGYHYGPVRNRNVHTLMEARMNDAENFPNVKERTVYADMIELFEAITAYREDYFKN